MANSKRILIIGTDRGIGLGLTQEFHARGWDVTATRLPGQAPDPFAAWQAGALERLTVLELDTTDKRNIDDVVHSLAGQTFDVIHHNAGIWGPMHQSTLEATPEEIAQLFMVNSVAPIRIVRRLIGCLPASGGTVGFSTSLLGSVAQNVEGKMDLYRASKAALNMMTRGLWVEIEPAGHTVLNVHPGWVATDMGTLGGTVEAEIDVPTSVRGMADVIEKHHRTNVQLFVDWQDEAIRW
jgi:NAD(P)-dependent dehydrogenase (short-subunit alcohol dehydrogenase family)